MSQAKLPTKPGWWWATPRFWSKPEVVKVDSDCTHAKWLHPAGVRLAPVEDFNWLGPVSPEPLAWPTKPDSAGVYHHVKEGSGGEPC